MSDTWLQGCAGRSGKHHAGWVTPGQRCPTKRLAAAADIAVPSASMAMATETRAKCAIDLIQSVTTSRPEVTKHCDSFGPVFQVVMIFLLFGVSVMLLSALVAGSIPAQRQSV